MNEKRAMSKPTGGGGDYRLLHGYSLSALS